MGRGKLLIWGINVWVLSPGITKIDALNWWNKVSRAAREDKKGVREGSISKAAI